MSEIKKLIPIPKKGSTVKNIKSSSLNISYNKIDSIPENIIYILLPKSFIYKILA